MQRTNKMTNKQYIVTGRVEGEESKVKIIIASDELSAMNTMEHFLKTEESWTIGEDVYVDKPILLQDAINSAIVETTATAIEGRYKKSFTGDISDVSFSFLISYEIATQFNGYDQALILGYLLEKLDQTEANYDENSEVISVLRYNEIVIEIDVNDKYALIAFWHCICAQEHARLVNLYQDNNLLLEIIDSEDVNFSDIPGMPR